MTLAILPHAERVKLFEQRARLLYMLDWARSLPTKKIEDLPEEKKLAFRRNIRLLRERLSEVEKQLCA